MTRFAKFFALSQLLAAFLLILLALIYHASRIYPPASSWLSLCIICFHIGAPLYIIDRFKLSLRDFNIYAYHIESLIDIIIPPHTSKYKPDYSGIRKELSSSLLILIIILFCYILAYYFYFHAKIFVFKLPPDFVLMLLSQIFVVALPEELFYRGFLQSSLQQKFSPVLAIIITNIFFALGHFVGNLDLTRLLTFFPGLIFSCLVYHYRSLLSAIIFHALFNITSHILALSIITR